MQIYLQQKLGQVSEARKAKGVKRKVWLNLVYHFGPDVKRQYEHLRLFLYEKPTKPIEKEHNKEVMMMAEQIRAKRLLEGQANQYGLQPTFKRKASFTKFFADTIKAKCETLEQLSVWNSVFKHFNNFVKGRDIRFEEVNEVFLENFKQYLLREPITKSGRQLSNNAALSYFNKVKTLMKEAFMQRIISENPATRVKSIKEASTKREYLTFEELQKLVPVPCQIEVLKRGFLFSCLTGLRHCDIRKMTWGELHYEENIGWLIMYTQQKTKSVENLPISDQAIQFLGADIETVKKNSTDPTLRDEKIFKGLAYDCWFNKKLSQWLKEAGIEKKITFHCGRHTFATLQLSLNTDMSTVSKMLGHKNLKTTQIYAQVMDSKKVEAANRIPQLF
ncbi:MAG: site-specific integrase [Taibaiella sp.]|jgi:integrase